MQVQPYLFFDGRCEEALAFYRSSLGAEVIDLLHFKDNPDPQMGCAGSMPPGAVMHATFRIGETTLMASDGMATGKPEFKGITLSLTVPDDAEARRLFEALGQGGQVQMPLARTFFSSSFGMLADRFGVSWMVVAMPAEAQAPDAAVRQ